MKSIAMYLIVLLVTVNLFCQAQETLTIKDWDAFSRKSYPDLRELTISDNHVRSIRIDPELFPKLEMLKVFGGAFDTIDLGMHPVLKELTLSSDREIASIIMLPPFLEEVRLEERSDNLKNVKLFLENCPTIDYLVLGFYHLKSLDFHPENLQIKELYLSQAFFPNKEEIFHDLGAWKSLEKLHISHCHISEIPFDSQLASRLVSLSIIGNRNLDPSGVNEYCGLRYLNLSQNQLSELYLNPDCMTALEEIDLHSNQFERVPKSLWMLKSIRMVNIQNNAVPEKKARQYQRFRSRKILFHFFNEFEDDFDDLDR